MASIRIKVSRGGYTTKGFGTSSGGTPDEIEIDVPVPDRTDAYGNGVRPTDYVAMLAMTFDKTAELVDVVRGRVMDAEVEDEEEEASA